MGQPVGLALVFAGDAKLGQPTQQDVVASVRQFVDELLTQWELPEDAVQLIGVWGDTDWPG